MLVNLYDTTDSYPTGHDPTFDWGEASFEPRDEEANSIWNGILDTDFFDNITLEVLGGRTLALTRVQVVLNGITILAHHYDGGGRSTYHLRDLISEYRAGEVAHSRSNPVLHLASQQLGKTWDSRYGNNWDPDDPEPDAWCTEFAAWVLRQATSLNPPLDPIPHTNTSSQWLARYFMGLVQGSDLEGCNYFIAPAHEIKLCDPHLCDPENPGRDLSNVSKSPEGNRARLGQQYCKYSLTPEGIDYCRDQGCTELVYRAENPNYCTYDDLGGRIRPGYYAKIKRSDHSTFFIHWVESPLPGRNRCFSAIGGNQDAGRIAVNHYFVAEDSGDIIWKATRHACDCAGYLDGFGRTDLPPPPAGVGRKRIVPPPAGVGWKRG
jgi:hypothetical protein